MATFTPSRKSSWSAIFTPIMADDLIFYATAVVKVSGSYSAEKHTLGEGSGVSYSPSIVAMAVSVAVCEIFSVKEWHDLEHQVWGRAIFTMANWTLLGDFHVSVPYSCVFSDSPHTCRY